MKTEHMIIIALLLILIVMHFMKMKSGYTENPAKTTAGGGSFGFYT